MFSRRSFLFQAAAVPILAADRHRLHLGAQTNAWRISGFPGLTEVLNKLRGYGFEGFETTFRNVQGQFDNPVPARDRIKGTGLHFFGVHIWLEKYDPETRIAPETLYREVGHGAVKLGAEHLILSGQPTASTDRKATALTAAGKFGAGIGLPVLYHNEFPEFANGSIEMDSLIERTDPQLLNLMLDAGHAYHAGRDVVAFFRKHNQRIAGMHLRDFKGDEQVPLGQGGFPLDRLAAVIRDTGWSGWLMNEEERVGSKPGDAAMAPARDRLFKEFGGNA